MFKKISFVTFVLIFTFVSTVFAHTGLQSSDPQNGEVVNEQLDQITLTFEGNIEQGSTFTLLNSNGESISVANISVNGNVLSGSLTDPLENGVYTVDWSVIGGDGHLIEDSFQFTVDLPVAETVEETEEPVEDDSEAEVTTQNENESQTETNVEENETNQANTTENTVAEQSKENSYLIPIIIGALVLIILISIVFLAKRKR
ncbi:CopC domain-containing protein OS=Ureibacillus acetophenoni OX=614649 GN=SAMN05877842_11580 PE=4 SV=1 [Ureibacillus acetophenoni]